MLLDDSSVDRLSLFFEDFVSVYLLDLLPNIDELGVKFIEVAFLSQLSQMRNVLGVEIDGYGFVPSVGGDKTDFNLSG